MMRLMQYTGLFLLLAAVGVAEAGSKESSIAIYDLVIQGEISGEELEPVVLRVADGQSATATTPKADGREVRYTISVEDLDRDQRFEPDQKQQTFLHAVVEIKEQGGSWTEVADPGATVDAPNSLAVSLPRADSKGSLDLSVEVMDILEWQVTAAQRERFQETGELCSDSVDAESSGGPELQATCCTLNCEGGGTGSCCVSSGPIYCCQCGDCCQSDGGGAGLPPHFCVVNPELCGFDPH